MTIETYPAMNAKIVELLRLYGERHLAFYAAQRIEELERIASTGDECLEIAMKSLRWYASDEMVYRNANNALVEIKQRLAELETEEKANDDNDAAS